MPAAVIATRTTAGAAVAIHAGLVGLGFSQSSPMLNMLGAAALGVARCSTAFRAPSLSVPMRLVRCYNSASAKRLPHCRPLDPVERGQLTNERGDITVLSNDPCVGCAHIARLLGDARPHTACGPIR
jgi:hypothetical protein